MTPVPVRRIYPGGQVSPENVVGRDDDTRRFWNQLLAGSCLLNEPRRIGKSSVLDRMTFLDKPVGWSFIHTSVQGVKTTDEFAALVLVEVSRHQSLTDRARHAVRGFLSDAEVTGAVGGSGLALRGAFRQTPLQALEAALSAVSRNLADDNAFLAIAWDEFPDAVLAINANEGPESAVALLGSLRRMREQNPDRVRWLLTGSVGLHHALRRLSSSGEQFITDLQHVPLGPLGGAWARWLAASLLIGAGVRFDNDAATELAGTTDGIPYLLHLLAAYARDHGPADLSAQDVPGLFVRAIGDLDASHQSTHLLSRLGDYYGTDTADAERLLDAVAASASSRQELETTTGIDETTTRRLVGLLERDHYLSSGADGRYGWRYAALRRIWMQRRSA